MRSAFLCVVWQGRTILEWKSLRLQRRETKSAKDLHCRSGGENRRSQQHDRFGQSISVRTLGFSLALGPGIRFLRASGLSVESPPALCRWKRVWKLLRDPTNHIPSLLHPPPEAADGEERRIRGSPSAALSCQTWNHRHGAGGEQAAGRLNRQTASLAGTKKCETRTACHWRAASSLPANLDRDIRAFGKPTRRAAQSRGRSRAATAAQARRPAGRTIRGWVAAARGRHRDRRSSNGRRNSRQPA